MGKCFLVYAIRATQITLALQDNIKKSSQTKVVAISSRHGSFFQNAKDNYSARYGYRRIATEMTKYDGTPTEKSASIISKAIKNNDIKNTGSYIDVTTGNFIEG